MDSSQLQIATRFEGMVLCDEYDRLCFDIRESDCTKEYQHLAGKSYIPNESGIKMDSTGLKDSKGVEVYEGDLIKDTDSEFIGEVIWDNDTLCFTTKFQSNELWGFVPRHGKDNHCRVIGNIYSDKELLKE